MPSPHAATPDGNGGPSPTIGLSPDELRYWTELYAREETRAEDARDEPFLIFRLGPERFALAMEVLDEVASLSHGIALPHVAPGVLGLANLRGEPLLLLDTARALAAEGAPRLGPDNRTLVVRDRKGRRTGLVVDTIEGVVPLDPGLFRLPAGGAGADSTVCRSAVGEYRDGPLTLVDVRILRDAIDHF